jgi:hypothetical protein
MFGGFTVRNVGISICLAEYRKGKQQGDNMAVNLFHAYKIKRLFGFL